MTQFYIDSKSGKPRPIRVLKEWVKVAVDTYRISVPGGYLYRYARSDRLTFVPKPPASSEAADR